MHLQGDHGGHIPGGARNTDDVVISGISGRFPKSSSVAEFKKNLFEGVDMVNDDPRRWEKGFLGLPERMGKIKDEDLQYFDQEFFSIPQKQTECLDPQVRMLLESSYEAILDAGLNPSDIRGSRTGVYVGVSTSDAEEHLVYNQGSTNGYGQLGCARAIFPSRISYAFDLKGPSYCVDTACSSSMYVFEHAFKDMRSGKCDSAIVAGTNLILKPQMTLQFKHLNMLSPDGKCQSFDKSNNGYVRSDACVVLFLQKAVNAKRIYATVLNVRTNTDGYKKLGITYPNGEMQNRLIRETYEEINLNPNEVVYVEAHGTGTKVGDPQEVASITDFFCRNRKSPLLIGSVKSNMGHAEAASGLCSIAKVLIAMEEGVIPANLHFKVPNPELKGLIDGRLKVVDKHTPWGGGIVGINSFGFGGANVHLILKSNPKPKILTPFGKTPKLVLCSGRTLEAVQEILDDAIVHRDDDEYLALINDIYSKDIPLHYYRGYSVMSTTGPLQSDIFEITDGNRPIWYIYPGMGTQWANMANDLMNFEVFSQSIHRCAEVLRSEDFDLLELLTNSSEKTFDNILNSFVAITAMQVALTDLLTSMGIKPDGVIGHSAGELGCAYVDGCFTREQTILASYWRGKSIVDTQLVAGKMAAIGLDWEEAHKRLPDDCYPVCHNSIDNCTISGPEKSIDAVVAKLTAEGVFAKGVKTSGYAFHSKYIADAGPKLRKSLEKIIPNAKNRTARWISTSIPEAAWNTPLAKQSSAAYHVNNLLSPVLFYEGLQHIPKNAVAIEIAPTGLFQAILKRTLGPDTTNISLIKRGHENNLEFFMLNVGKLYAAGAQPQVMPLYKRIAYPVGRGTPMLNSKIGWDHSKKWFVPHYGKKSGSFEAVVEIDLSTEKDAFLAGHVTGGRIIFPATGYLTLAWTTFAKLKGIEHVKCPVIMENVVIHQATILSKKGVVKFSFNMLNGTSNFEICEGGRLVMSGTIYQPEKIDLEELQLDELLPNRETIELNAKDVYKELRIRGFHYSGIFRGIVQSDTTSDTGHLQWLGNWISFMDSMLQFHVLSKKQRELYFPTHIGKVVLNPVKHLEHIGNLSLEQQAQIGIPVFMYKDIGVVKSGGIELRELKFASVKRSDYQYPTLERHTFVPYVNKDELHGTAEKSQSYALTVALQIILENSQGALKIKGVEIANGRDPNELLASKLLQILEGEPAIKADIVIAAPKPDEEAITLALGANSGLRIIAKDIMEEPVAHNCHFIYAVNALGNFDPMFLENSLKTVNDNGFLLCEESINSYRRSGRELLNNSGLTVISEQPVGQSRILITARKPVHIKQRDSEVIHVTENNFDWLEKVKGALAKAVQDEHYVYIVSQGEELFGAMGFMNCLRKESGGKHVRMIFIQDKDADHFSLTSEFYAQQLAKDLIINVLKSDGVWGSYRHLKLDSDVATARVEHAYVNSLVKGDISSLRWIECPPFNPRTLDDNTELCRVSYAGINFRDVMLASGKISADVFADAFAKQDCFLGMEFAGIDSKGRRVMALVPFKALATTCVANRNMMWEVPEHWSMADACTVPCVYATVYYALMVRGQMKEGEKILIHSGAGGVGQAAIAVALHHGLTVFTTVGNDEKRAVLKKRFPQLKDSHIGNSRDCSFEQMIMSQTQGDGVDLILNSLAGDKMQASIRCLGLDGRFLELGVSDLSNNSALGMSIFLKNTSFHGISLESVLEGDVDIQAEVAGLIAKGVETGAVKPLPHTVFKDNQIEEAFRFMATGNHIGKVLIKVRGDGADLKESLHVVNAIGRTYMNPEKSYIIVGGLGGFGLELANWLVSRGAKFLVLTSRSGVKTGYQSLMISRWQEGGVSVTIDTNDITTPNGCQKLLESANEVAPVGGIFNLAAVLRDAHLQDQTVENFQIVCEAKVKGTKLLDQLSRTMCKTLDYFVCFSSASSGRGLVGQTNYGLANSAMERICEMRQASGLPGLAIQWGVIGDTGLFIENLGDNDTALGGTFPQKMTSCLETIDSFMQQPYPVLASMVVLEKQKPDRISGGSSLICCVANIMGLRDIKYINDSSSLADLGLDSLTGAEIKQAFEHNFDIVMSVQEIRQLTFGQLKGMSEGNADIHKTL